MLGPSVLRLADPARVDRVLDAILADRRRARPAHPLPVVVRLDPRGVPEPGAPSPKALARARELIVVATGADRAEALHALLAGPGGDVATVVRAHPEALVLCDRAAAARLDPEAGDDDGRVVVVLGHREPGVSAEHRISSHTRARLYRAQELCLQTPVRAAILTGWTHTDGLSEAEQMAREWTLPGVPVLLEVAGRDTAENASCSLGLVLALGGARRVTVVTSRWHVRTPLFFAPYRDHGLAVDVVWARPLRHWAHLLAHELRSLPRVPAQRRAAMAAVAEVAGSGS
ncbi:hypothetical protein FSW04_25360 [Baekduia soli]|uniref:DUF218 domain-containing protein n=1 Tax=Baekduia soli TaxID=496014 RepID=A0A5B8UBQ8_9ACTN|nr:YdcF family protein [Baekduia soli]QEC50586.1 hypothetical protein FSW04_25360 [Baekduia soli]